MKAKLLPLVWLASTAAFGADKEFDQLVKAIESHYGTKPRHTPFMGVANFVLRTAHPEGVAGFKLAVFEDLAASPEDAADAPPFMNGLAVKGMHPLVQTRSKRDGESTYIYVGASGKYTRLLLATFEPHAATVVEVRVSLETLLKVLQDPERMSDSLGVKSRQSASDPLQDR